MHSKVEKLSLMKRKATSYIGNALASIKNGLRVSFLLLACSVVISQSILPHIHHHNEILYFVFDASALNDVQCGKNHCCTKHDHSAKNLGDCCREEFIVPREEVANNNFQLISFPDSYYISTQDNYLPDCLEFVEESQIPLYLYSPYLVQIVRSEGLRAPPSFS